MSFLYLLYLIPIALLLQYLNTKHAFDGIDYGFHADVGAAECSEPFELVTTVSNRKPYPVLFLRLTETAPYELQLEEESQGVRLLRKDTVSYQHLAIVEQTMYLLGRQRVRRVLKASLSARGRYLFTGATVSVGDILGLEEHSKRFRVFQEIVILPQRMSFEEIDSAFGNYLGDISVKRYILSDPVLTVGFHEYTGREPQRDISWPRSLRDGRMMVKQYDYTAELTATVILNIASTDKIEADVIERCYTLTRFVCERLESRRISYSFFTNAAAAGVAGSWSYIPDGVGQQHLRVILEGLGRATYSSSFSLPYLLSMATTHIDVTRAIILVTPVIDERSAACMNEFEKRTQQRIFKIEACSAAAKGGCK